MIQRASLIALTLMLGAAPALAENVQLPIRKAGLWEVSMQVTGVSKMATPPMVTQQCTDDSVDHLMNRMSTDSMTCSKQETSKSGASYVADSICTVAGSTVTTHAEATGDFNSAYSVKTVAKTSGGTAQSLAPPYESQYSPMSSERKSSTSRSSDQGRSSTSTPRSLSARPPPTTFNLNEWRLANCSSAGAIASR